MKSSRLPSGSTYYAHQHNALRSDAVAAAWLHVHQQLGALALGTGPSNNQTVTFIINGTSVVFNAVTGSPTNPGDVKAPGTAAGFVANLYAALINPTTTTSTFVALSAANAQLVQYLGWGFSTGGTTITPYSLNTSTYGPLTSFSASTTVTSGSWTGQTMQLYVEPGTYYVGATRVLYLGGSTPTITAPSSHPRIDLVTADSSGTIALVTGTENASPVAPSYPANKLVLAEIYNVVGETALYDNDNQQTGQGYVSNDVRPAMAPPYISSASQVASGLFILDPGSEAQGDILYYNGSAWARLPAGTSGFHLTTQGASANPQWTAPNTAVSFDAFTDVTVSIPGTSTETTIVSGTVQAMAANSSLLVRFCVENTGGGGVPTYALSLNGTDLFTFGSSYNGKQYIDVLISNRNSTSAQFYIGHNLTAGNTITNLMGTAAISLGSSFTLAVTCKQTVTSNATCHSLFVLPING